MTFKSFDPLEFKNTAVNEAALGALKREIENILSSYVGWYDPFCELIQNSLDAVEARSSLEISSGSIASYTPKINIIIDLDENTLTVSDNGIGLDKEKFEQFLAPNFSFKSGKTRGHKGVGATYVAYGFNFMRISTKVPDFEASGRIVNARNWIKSIASGANPKVEPIATPDTDPEFQSFDRGVSINVRFDDTTHPKKLNWIKTETAEQWHKILSIKTGLGSVQPDSTIITTVIVKSNGVTTTHKAKGTGYLWLHNAAGKSATIRDIADESEKTFAKFGANRKLKDKYRNLDFMHDTWTPSELGEILKGRLDEEDINVLKTYSPSVSVEFGSTTKLWQQFNNSLGIRNGYKVLNTGIQLAANNMPQGETLIVPLKRYVGRQNQVHFLIHFDNYTPDLGRKGFHRELSDFAKSVSQKLMENHLSKYYGLMKPNTGVSPDLVRGMQVSNWKKDMLGHEAAKPLDLTNKHFFLPVERVSITSDPTREQDVIALFHQLIAGGVIRGLRIMSTNERFTYDGLFKIGFDLKKDLYIYDEEKNPLGVSEETVDGLFGIITEPMILEYKFSLDGLIEDFESNDKNIKDVDLCIAWETGEQYLEKYGITSLLISDNASQRQYHGVTHVLQDLETGARHCDLIILEELIKHLNDPKASEEHQVKKYE
ncbi:ATP-binding protein [Pseudomonas sp. LS1212]|uniref:ATP-binding protein n=1 Tax=Pseudomonas sp. LS1212 TaxID=2972478 RepID=UPI00215B8CDF|nr:ATP-binding protein [Pseudomonas sp. LS1212]UVJ42217.1 ATP-binding protein [Pseudomonas sp. LS1212]